MMKPRNLIESFSTFVQFNSQGRFQNWQSDPKLDRSMRKCLDQETSPSTMVDYWIRYWHQVWQIQPESLARTHLFSYLQEPCYQAAEKFWFKFQSYFSQDKVDFSQEKIEDYFNTAILKTDKLLSRFNPQHPTANFQGFAAIFFHSKLIDEKRRLLKNFGLTDWSLLNKISSNQLTKALQKYGISSEQIPSYVLAWQCYKAIYPQTQKRENNKFKEPDNLVYQKIIDAYHSLKNPEDLDCNLSIIKNWLKTCATAIRNLNTLPVNSLNQILDTGTELIGIIPSEDFNNSESLIAHENRQLIHEALFAYFQEFKKKQKAEVFLIFQLYYCTKPQPRQAEIAIQVFGDTKQQHKVSRRLTSIKKNLLNYLSQWLASHFNLSLNSEIINNINQYLEDWLINHSQDICRQFE